VDVTVDHAGQHGAAGELRDRPAIRRRRRGGLDSDDLASAHKTSAPPGITARPSKALSARIASLPVPRFAVTSPITFSSSFLT
jgi:hypothetical protein